MENRARNVNTEGLGDRRGLAIEKVPGPRLYRSGTLEVIQESGPDFVAYIDGVQVARRRTYEEALERGAHALRGQR